MKKVLSLVLFVMVMCYVQNSYAISIGGSVRGGGFGIGASSDGSATVSGGRGPASGSVRIEGSSDSSSSSSSNSSSQDTSSSSSSASGRDPAIRPIFEISLAELPKYKGKTPKVYARINGQLLYSDIIFLGYNKEKKLVVVDIVDRDGFVRPTAMSNRDMRFRMPKGDCVMKGEEFVCPQ